MKFYSKEKIPFTQVANEVLNDSSLSLKAKGLFAYLFSKPDGWDFSVYRMEDELKESRYSLRHIIQELEDHKYLVRKKMSDGKMEYQLQFTEPRLQSATLAKSHPGETRPINNIEVGSNTDSGSKKEVSPPPLFEKIWQAYPAVRRGASRPAYTAIRKALQRSGMTADDMLRVVKRYARVVADKDPRFEPLFQTWMNDDRFEWSDDQWNADYVSEAPPPRHRWVGR